MKHLPRRDSERGMSLIEVMVALIVSAIGLFGALALIGTLLKGGDFSRRMTEASVLGQYKLEEMVSWQYGCIATSAQAGCPATSFPSLNTACPIPPTGMTIPATPNETVDSLGRLWVTGTSTGTQFNRFWDGCTPVGTRKRIYVWVQWKDGIGTHTVSLSRERSQ
jgi:prepilin-type N-terminal cleavage/methylation domain-containing protein